jgi:hypothetical protein
MTDAHVVTKGDGWAREVDGQQRGDFDTQDDAIQVGRQLAEQENGELVIHGADGESRERD